MAPHRRTSGPPATGSSSCSTSCEATAEPRAVRPGRGAAAPGHRALRRRPGPGASSWRAPAGAGPGRRASSADDLVASLLLVHGLHPETWRSGWRARWPRSGRSSAAHGGDVELLEVDDEAGAVRLRLLGSCDGCPSSAVTLQSAVERAIIDAAPEIVASRSTSRPAAASRRRRSRLGRQAGADDESCPAEMAGRVTDPLGRAAADPPGRAPPRRSAAGGALRAVQRAHRRRARPPGRPRGAQPAAAPAGAATCSSPPTAPAARRYRAVPDRYLALADFAAVARPVGRPADPGRRGVLLPQLRRSGGWPPSIPARPAPPSPSCSLDDLGARSWRPTRCWRRSQPDVEALLVRLDRDASGRRVLPRADRRLLRAGRPPPPAVARLRRRPRGPRRGSTPSSRGSRSRATDDRRLAFEVVDARRRAARRGADHHAPRLRVDETDGGDRPRAGPALPDPDRAAAAAATSRKRRSASTSCSARRRSGATRCGPFLWTHVSTTLAGFTGSTEVDLPVECTYDFEVAAAKYLHALAGRRDPAACCCSRAPCSPAATSGFAAEPVAWDREARLPAAGRGLARASWTCYFPDSGWLRVRRDDPRPAPAVQGRREALPTWDQAFEQLLKQAGEARDRPSRSTATGSRRPGRSPTPCSTRATCCTRTGRRRARTRCAGSSACSSRRRFSEATARSAGRCGPSACVDAGPDARAVRSGSAACRSSTGRSRSAGDGVDAVDRFVPTDVLTRRSAGSTSSGTRPSTRSSTCRRRPLVAARSGGARRGALHARRRRRARNW